MRERGADGETEGDKECVIGREGERERVRVREKERESEREREREREKERDRESVCVDMIHG